MTRHSDASPSVLEAGDRVRIRRPDSEYTGCRGTIAAAPGARADRADGQGSLPLGHFVAIDGENGVVRPFLLEDIELLRPASVRRATASERALSGAPDRRA